MKKKIARSKARSSRRSNKSESCEFIVALETEEKGPPKIFGKREYSRIRGALATR